MRKHYKIIVTGKVQGVFYRKNTKQKAQELGLTGYVKNMPDGTVKIEAEGEGDKLEILKEWCYQGSPAANVSNVKVETSNDLKNYSKFTIKYD